jgi:hypothetical protein
LSITNGTAEDDITAIAAAAAQVNVAERQVAIGPTLQPVA